MTFSEQKAMLNTLTGVTFTDSDAQVYLSLSATKILKRLFPFDNTVEEVPVDYHVIQVELATRLFLRKGAEGELIHNENGVNRTYGSVDDSDILDKILPYARLV